MITAFGYHFVEQVLPTFIDGETGCLCTKIEHRTSAGKNMISVAGGKGREQGFRTNESMLDATSGLREGFLQLGINGFAAVECDIMRFN